MTTISNKDIARAIYSSSKGKTGASLAGILKNAVQFLHRKRLLSRASDIQRELRIIINQAEGRIVFRVSSRERLEGEIRTELAQFLKKRYSAKEVILEEILDDKLLGGFKVELDDEVIDLTILNKMKRLQEHLIGRTA
jgi:F0F1-type ATP synthase delta subunit